MNTIYDTYFSDKNLQINVKLIVNKFALKNYGHNQLSMDKKRGNHVNDFLLNRCAVIDQIVISPV